MDDIVARLRKMDCQVNGVAICINEKAADEIERLRRLGDMMAYFVRSGDAKEMDSAVQAWQEARRG